MIFKVFVETNIYEHVMPPAWWRHQNKEIFVYLYVDCICLFDKLLLTCIFRVLRNQPWHLLAYNHADAYCVLTSSEQGYFFFFEYRLPFFIPLTVAYTKFKVLWKQPYMSLQLGWCLLRNDVIKVGKFLFVWTLLIVST